MPAKTFFPLLSLLVVTSPAHAVLLAHESFTGYATGNLGGQNSTGFGFSGAWTARYDNDIYNAYHQPTSSDGLTFAGLATSGGALPFSSAQTRLTGIALNPASLPSGGFTLYSSYLVNLSNIANGDSGAGIRISTTTVTDSVGYLGTFADTRAGTNNSNIAVSYDTFYAPNYNQSGAPLATGQTYLMIASYTSINDGSGSGTATLHAINQAQYATYLASGLSFDAYAASTTIGNGDSQIWSSASHTTTTNPTFDNSDYFQILTRLTTGTIDEIRFGTSYADVLPIPEPSSALLAIPALAGSLSRRRRR